MGKDSVFETTLSTTSHKNTIIETEEKRLLGYFKTIYQWNPSHAS